MEIIKLNNYIQPEVIESKSEDGYTTFGANNTWYSYLEDCYNGSVTNRSVINSIALMIYGKGLTTIDDVNINLVKELFKPNDLRMAIIDFKKLGQCSFQIGYNKERTKIVKVEYFPVFTLAKGKMDKDGNVKYFHYSKNWKEGAYNIETKKISAFGTSKTGPEILYIQNYSGAMMYYSNVDYHSALAYCKIEEELANYHLNNISNAFAPSTFISFNNGVPTPKEQREIEQKILNKWGGTSNAGKIMVSFSDTSDNAPTINTHQISDAHSQYQFISDEAESKIFVGHRVTSPMLLGIKNNTGLGNNADELITAFQLFNATVIRPFQDIILDGLNQVMKFNGIEGELYFETLQPIEFTEDGKEQSADKAEIEKETGVEMSADNPFLDAVLDYLCEDAPEGYSVHKVEDIGDEPADVNYEKLYNELNVDASAIQKSEQDSPMYKVRYRYKKHVSGGESSRAFCIKMRALADQDKVFRKEDILKMDSLKLNPGHGHNGQAYSIWLYKGGVNCHDVWRRVIYKKNYAGQSGNPLQHVTEVSVADAARKGYRPPTNESEVSIAPIRMPGGGKYPG
jgi:hypothetical protein